MPANWADPSVCEDLLVLVLNLKEISSDDRRILAAGLNAKGHDATENALRYVLQESCSYLPSHIEVVSISSEIDFVRGCTLAGSLV
ncbi:hypothetical protein MN608_00985 [Microdochium nivale]|nr:hypothetical protein MN608_00985 [Microdochium nivale]